MDKTQLGVDFSFHMSLLYYKLHERREVVQKIIFSSRGKERVEVRMLVVVSGGEEAATISGDGGRFPATADGGGWSVVSGLWWV